MKLRNKKTGEIGWLETDYGETDEKMIAVLDKKIEYHPYNSLAELNEEWEDYEEPKEYWYMSNRGDIRCIDDEDTDWDNDRKLIGNYFETREEAEKAVEKLKAFKRLKDKGFRFVNLQEGMFGGAIKYKVDEESEETTILVRHIFGGEE